MPAELDVLPRLLALEAGRAFPRASHLQVAIHADALVLCCLAMAGEDTTVHAVAFGRVGRPPTLLSIANPRHHTLQYALLERIADQVETYFGECRTRGTHPQIWVSSAAGVAHLGTIADYYRMDKRDAKAQRLGELLSYVTERHPHAGQQALFSATSALQMHWATGQDAGDDEHLGSLLAWIDPPAAIPIDQALARVRTLPLGVKTDPDFDRTVLLPLLQAYNHARRTKAPTATRRRYATDIRGALEPVVARTYAETQRAIAILQGAGLPLLPDLADMEEREVSEFESYMISRDNGQHLPLRDKPKAAVFGLVAREDSQHNADASLMRGDRIARARAQLNGQILVGDVASLRSVRLSSHKTEYQFDVVSNQRLLRVRLRDELALLDDPRLRVRVVNVRRGAGVTRVSVVLTKGERCVGVPKVGQMLHLSKQTPDWARLARDRGHLRSALAARPWTHDTRGFPIVPARPAPADPLAEVEKWR